LKPSKNEIIFSEFPLTASSNPNKKLPINGPDDPPIVSVILSAMILNEILLGYYEINYNMALQPLNTLYPKSPSPTYLSN